MGSTEIAYFLSMLAVFVGALIVLVMLTNAFSRYVRSSPLGKPDRILGAGFGVLCTWVAIGTIFLFWTYLGTRTLPPAVEGAASFPMIKEMANFVEPHLPAGFRTRLQDRGTDSGAIPLPSPAAPAVPTAPAPPSDPAAPPAQAPTTDTKPPQ